MASEEQGPPVTLPMSIISALLMKAVIRDSSDGAWLAQTGWKFTRIWNDGNNISYTCTYTMDGELKGSSGHTTHELLLKQIKTSTFEY